MRRKTAPLTVIAVAALTAGLLPGPADATYPGRVGLIAYATDLPGTGPAPDTDLYTVLPSGRAPRQLTSGGAFDACPAWSPTGRSLAYCSNASGSLEIWRLDAQRPERRRQVTRLGAFSFFPDYSPNGWHIAFMSSSGPGEPADIYTVSTLGTGLRRLTDAAGDDAGPVWSPDGSRIAFVSDRTGVPQVWTIRRDGSDQRQLTVDPTPKDLPDWSPDGTRLAYSADVDGNVDIHVMGADGSSPRRLTTDPAVDVGASWSPDGRRIAFARDPGDLGGADRALVVMDVRRGNERVVTAGVNGVRVPAWQPRQRS